MPRQIGITHFQGSNTVQELLFRDTYESIGIRGSVDLGSRYLPSVFALFLLLIDFCEGSVLWPARRAVRRKIEGDVCVPSIGHEASVSTSDESWCVFDGVGGSRRRGSEMSNASKAPAGRAPGSVTEASECHSDWGASTAASQGVGCSIEQSVSAAAGPIISIEPISNRRSSTVTAGFCTFEMRMISFHVWKNALG